MQVFRNAGRTLEAQLLEFDAKTRADLAKAKTQQEADGIRELAAAKQLEFFLKAKQVARKQQDAAQAEATRSDEKENEKAARAAADAARATADTAKRTAQLQT